MMGVLQETFPTGEVRGRRSHAELDPHSPVDAAGDQTELLGDRVGGCGKRLGAQNYGLYGLHWR